MKNARPACCSAVSGGRAACSCAVAPRFERGRLLGDHQQRHVRVLQATELGALAAIHAGPIGGEGQVVAAARDQILLAREIGHPEGVDDVRRAELDADWAPHRDVDLVRGDQRSVGRFVAIGDLPPPLIAAQPDHQRVVSRNRQSARGGIAHDSKHDDDQHAGRDRRDPR